MIRQPDAVLRLLRDDDASTVRLVQNQLAEHGAKGLADLRALIPAADERATRHLREVISEIETREADAIFAQFCAGFGDHGDVEEAAWRLAAAFLPGEDFSNERSLLDAWGEEVAARIRKAPTDLDRIETLVEFLGHDLRLRGNEEDYYNINNSLLPEVIGTRTGIPISLSLVYMLVGQRAGIAVHGVGLPGHFVVRHGEHFFDPFHGGRRIGLDECRAFAEQCNLTLTAQHLQPITPRHMLIRMLNNIYTVTAPGDPMLAGKVSGWMQALAG